jgi:hypothetical protein
LMCDSRPTFEVNCTDNIVELPPPPTAHYDNPP